VAYGIGQKMNFGSNVQTISVPLGIFNASVQVPIDCDRCGKKPIVGTRYKCG